MKLHRLFSYNKEGCLGPTKISVYLKSSFNDYNELKLYLSIWGKIMKE